MEQTIPINITYPGLDGQKQPIGQVHACKAFWRDYHKAREGMKRAERDLGETTAFMAASLTTVTALQAVISIAKDKLEFSKEILQLAFQCYVVVFTLILLLGAVRVAGAIRRRTQAEKEIDLTRKGIFEFCDEDQWPRIEE